jgi:hypothetical protein
MEVVLNRSQVEKQIHRRPEKIEYERIRPRYPDTVEGQWELAEWCRECHLLTERERHLERILEIEPNHEKARRGLGYGRMDGQWKTQEQAMKEQGYVWYEHSWRLPQEITLIKERKARTKSDGEWKKKLGQWHRWLNTDRAAVAVENIRSIDDPYAVTALWEALKKEPHNEQRRLLFIEALANIGTPGAMGILAKWSLADPIEEVGLTCIDHLKAAGDYNAVEFFMTQLRSKENAQINRAATALKHMGNPVAIPALIDALLTTHKQTVTVGKPGQVGSTFGTGGGSPGGLSVGSKTVVVTQRAANRAVLEALIELSGGKNFNFDVAAWKSWYAVQQRGAQLDARRG